MIKKILIVDDSKAAQFFLKGCIPKDKGFEIFTADNGVEGLKKFNDIRPDVIFLDLTMPEMDGVTLLTEIKRLESQAIIIVLTANVQRKVLEEVKHLGAFGILRKPPQKEQVRSMLFGAGKEMEKMK